MSKLLDLRISNRVCSQNVSFPSIALSPFKYGLEIYRFIAPSFQNMKVKIKQLVAALNIFYSYRLCGVGLPRVNLQRTPIRTFDVNTCRYDETSTATSEKSIGQLIKLVHDQRKIHYCFCVLSPKPTCLK